jgi:hypothetical protein
MTRCGWLTERGKATDDPVTCRTCLGDREWRGRRSVRPQLRPPSAPRCASDLRRTDAALARLEELNAATTESWLAQGREHRDPHGYAAPHDAFPPPPVEVAGLIVELEVRYEGQRRPDCRSTTAAHDELLRLQSYLLPTAEEDAS